MISIATRGGCRRRAHPGGSAVLDHVHLGQGKVGRGGMSRHPGSVIARVRLRLGEVRQMSAIGTNPNLPSRLRSGRYRVITRPSATRGQHYSSATPRQLT